MAMRKLKEVTAEIEAKHKQVDGLFTEGDKRGGENTPTEIESIKALNKEIEELSKEAEEIAAFDDARKSHEQRKKDLATPVGGPGFDGKQGREEQGQTGKVSMGSLGARFLNDPAMKGWLKQFEGRPPTSSGSIPKDAPKVDIKTFFPERHPDSEAVKTLLTGVSSTSAGAMVFPEWRPNLFDRFYERPLMIRDLITIGETMSDQISYPRLTGVTNNAGTVAEATATGDGSGAKPESAMVFEQVTENVKTIAHWIPVTTRALADAGQIRTEIDAFLRYGIEEELEDQIINRTGSGEDFDGILNRAGVTQQAFDTNVLTTTRKARTKVRITGRTSPTAWVMHPNDWETIDLLQDNENRYYYGGPMRVGQPTLWGIPVVESEAMPQGTSVVANWRMAILWDRMQSAITMSNSHSDFFIRNLIAVLAEMRAAFTLRRPAAFVETDMAM
jgi:HK97 family phage major capsid protein